MLLLTVIYCQQQQWGIPMTNIFSKVKPATKNEVEQDRLGGGGTLPTDIYKGTVKAAYLQKSASSEAMSVNFLIDVNGHEIRSRTWTTNRTGGVTYKDKKSGEDVNLPGYNLIASAALMGLGIELHKLEVEERTLKLYDFTAGKEVNQAVNCFVEFHGQEITFGLQEQTVDKTKDDGTGKYVPTGETRTENEIVKFYANEPRVTGSELKKFIEDLGGSFDDVVSDGDLDKALAKMTDDQSVYATAWLDKNKGKVFNKASANSKAATGGGNKSLDSGASNEQAESAKKSLFD